MSNSKRTALAPLRYSADSLAREQSTVVQITFGGRLNSRTRCPDSPRVQNYKCSGTTHRQNLESN
jgi:hypothetical protein